VKTIPLFALMALALSATIAWSAPIAGFNNSATEAERSTALEIAFETGQSALSAATKQRIDEHLASAKRRGQITRVNIIGWGDVSYPSPKVPVLEEQKKIARKRGEELKSYIDSRNLKVKTAAINMTERPSALLQLLNGADTRTKQMLEATGITGGSRAVVMVITR